MILNSIDALPLAEPRAITCDPGTPRTAGARSPLLPKTTEKPLCVGICLDVWAHVKLSHRASVDQNLLLSIHVPGLTPFPLDMLQRLLSTEFDSATDPEVGSALPHRCEDSIHARPDTSSKSAQDNPQQCCHKRIVLFCATPVEIYAGLTAPQ